MTIVFQGHVSKMEATGAGEVEVTIQTPMDPCDGKPIAVRMSQVEAKHWMPGRMVSFTLYTLPDGVATDQPGRENKHG